MPPLSVVIISFNEEHNIARCLQSVKDIADEILVVDSFSTDNTRQICESFGARVIEHAFEGHIAQKNFARLQAAFPHQLSLDADEALSEMLSESIREAKNRWNHDGYAMNRLTNYCGKWIKHCGWYPDTKLRLYDSRKGSWGGDDPHDKIIMQPGTSTGFLEGDILHYSYYTLDDHYRQVHYFTDILSKSQFLRGKKAGLPVMVLSPVVKFLRDYFLHLGFLDGREGFTICRISAWATYLKYRKIRKLMMASNTKSHQDAKTR